MNRSLTLVAVLLSALAAAPALAQNTNIAPGTLHRAMCKTQAVTFFAQTSQSAVSGWEANAGSQHGAIWRHWNAAAGRSLVQVNHSHYGLVWRAQGRPCRNLGLTLN